jgi:branched-chain amino acid transport system ATP-binding protein
MPMIGGTTSWVGPLVGALLLGTLQQVATVTISSAVNLLIVGLLLVGFVIVAPKGIIGLVQDFMRERTSDKGPADVAVAPRHLRQHAAGSALMAEPAASRRQSQQTLRRLCRIGRHQFVGQPGERVGLIGPNGSGKSTWSTACAARCSNETGTVRFDGQIVDGLAANQRTHRGMARSFQLPRPFHTLSVAENLRIPLLFTAHSRSGRHLTREETESRCHELAGLVGLAAKANKLPRDLTQVEMRKLELARAMAADPKLLIADEAMAGLSQSEVTDIVDLLIKLNERGVTII